MVNHLLSKVKPTERPLLYALMVFAAAVLTVAAVDFMADIIGLDAKYFVLGANIIIISLIAVTTRRRFGSSFYLGFNGRSATDSFLLSATLFSGAALIFIIGMVSGYSIGSAFAALLIALETAFFEELMVSGLMLNNMMRVWCGKKHGVYKCLASSAIIFGLTHLMLRGFFSRVGISLLVAVALGVFLSAVYLRTRNLWGVVAAHAYWEFCSLVLIPQGSSAHVSAHAAGPEITAYENIVTIIVAIAAGIYLVRPAKHELIKANWADDGSLDAA